MVLTDDNDYQERVALIETDSKWLWIRAYTNLRR